MAVVSTALDQESLQERPQEWLVELELEAEHEPTLEEAFDFRDRVWHANGALRRAARGWTVALIVPAADHQDAAERGRATLRSLRCAFARLSALEASPVA